VTLYDNVNVIRQKFVGRYVSPFIGQWEFLLLFSKNRKQPWQVSHQHVSCFTRGSSLLDHAQAKHP
jgi:hypothetical protein